MNPGTLIFGGAVGVDMVALVTAALSFKKLKRIVIVPGVVGDQPKDARAAIRKHATEVVELGLPLRYVTAWLKRNDAMLDRASHVLAFWDGRAREGPRSPTITPPVVVPAVAATFTPNAFRSGRGSTRSR